MDELDLSVGILVRPWPRRPTRPVIDRVVRDLAAEGRSRGVRVVALTPHAYDRRRGTVTAWVPAGRRWRAARVPVPPVVYNQIRSRIRQGRFDRSPLAAALRRAGVPVFNPGFLDKMEVHRTLAAVPAVASHLPETAPLDGGAVLGEFLGRHDPVYVKPRRGSLGRGVIRLRRRAHHAGFRVDAYLGRARGLVRLKARTADGLHRALARIALPPCIVQQGVALLQAGGVPCDARVLAQRGRGGRWRVTHWFFKAAGRARVVTNVHAGGRVLGPRRARRVLAEGGFDPGDVVARLKRLALAAAVPLGEAMGLGEVGLDIAVDPAGRLWILEANSRYARSVFPRRARRLSLARPLEYARHLAGAAGRRPPRGPGEVSP